MSQTSNRETSIVFLDMAAVAQGAPLPPSQMAGSSAQLMSHASTPCRTPLQSTLDSVNGLMRGGNGLSSGLLVPASACPPGTQPPPCGAPIHPNAASNPAPKLHPNANTPLNTTSSSSSNPATATAPSSNTGGKVFTYQSHEEFVKAMQAERGIKQADVSAMQDKNVVIKVVKYSIDLTHSPVQLQATPELATVNLPWSVINPNSKAEPTAALLSVSLKSKSGGAPCGVRLECDQIDSNEHLEYHARTKKYGITHWSAGENAPGPVPEDYRTRYLRTFTAPMSILLKHTATPRDKMFSDSDCTLSNVPGAPFYNVRCESKLGRALVSIAVEAERRREDARRTGQPVPESILASHPDTWAKHQVSNGHLYWNVDAPIIHRIQKEWNTVKDNEIMKDMSKGVNFTFRRADGLDWADVHNMGSELADQAQEDVLNMPANIKTDLELVFMLPPESASD